MASAATIPPARRNQHESQLDNFLRQRRIFLDLNAREAPGHEEIFDDIKALGTYDLQSYRSGVTIESRQRPRALTESMLRRARRVSDKARACSKARKNEAGWRFGLESEILSRFEIEVVW